MWLTLRNVEKKEKKNLLLGDPGLLINPIGIDSLNILNQKYFYEDKSLGATMSIGPLFLCLEYDHWNLELGKIRMIILCSALIFPLKKNKGLDQLPTLGTHRIGSWHDFLSPFNQYSLDYIVTSHYNTHLMYLL